MKLSSKILTVIGLLSSVSAFAGAPPTYHEIKKIDIGGEGFWDYLFVDSPANRLYVSHSNKIIVVDTAKGAVCGEIPNTPGVHGVAIAPKLHRGFTSNGGDNTVTIFDTITLKTIEKVKVGSGPDAIIFDPNSNRVFTFNAGSKDATALDAVTGKVVGGIPLGGKPEFSVSDEKGQMYVNIEDKNEIISFDAKTLKVKAHWPISPGEEASGLAIDLKNHKLFAVCGNDKMIVMDYLNGKVVATPEIGKGADAAVYDPGTGYAISSNGQSGNLTIVEAGKEGTYKVVANVPTVQGARTMALDPKSHNLYLAAAKFGPMAPGDRRRRPQIQPNSFYILVMGK